MTRILGFCLAAGLLLLAPGDAIAQDSQPAAAAEEGRFREDIAVTELELLVELPISGRRVRRQLDSLVADGLLVLEDGEDREVSKMAPVTGSEDSPPAVWNLMIYIDAPLAGGTTVRSAALALGAQAQRLTDLGWVEIVVADPQPRHLLEPTREAHLVEERLAALARTGSSKTLLALLEDELELAIRRGEAGDADARKALARIVGLVRQQSDGLVETATTSCQGAPCALFLISDGYPLAPNRSINAPTPGDLVSVMGRTSQALEAISAEVAKTIASYSWVTFPLPFRDPNAPDPISPEPHDPLEQVEQSRPLEDRVTTPVISVPIGRRSTRASMRVLPPAAHDVFVLPKLAPLRHLAEVTSGFPLRVPAQLPLEIAALSERWRVWYRTPRPLDGRIRPIEIRLSDRDEAARAPAWIRSSTPEAVAGARLRRVLTESLDQGRLAVTVGGDDRRAEVTVDFGDLDRDFLPTPIIPMRVSVLVGPPDRIQHELVSVEDDWSGPDWSFSVALPGEGAAVLLAACAEDLATGYWGCAEAAREGAAE